jgi:hypothetical protein
MFRKKVDKNKTNICVTYIFPLRFMDLETIKKKRHAMHTFRNLYIEEFKIISNKDLPSTHVTYKRA